MRKFHETGKTAAAWDNNGGRAYYENGKTAAAWDNNGGRAYYENGKTAAAWDNNGGRAYYENGNSKGQGTEIYLGDGIRIYAGPGGVGIYVNGESVNSNKNSNESLRESNTTRETNNESSNSDSNQPIVSYSKCSNCGDKFKDADGYYSYLRKGSKVYKLDFCSKACINDKLSSGDYIQVDKNGLTSSERSDIFLEKVRQDDETKRIEKEKERKETRLAIKIGIPVLVLAIVYFIYSNNEMTKQKSEAVRINLELEQIEDSVKLYINSGNYDRALILTNQLVHPLNELYEGKGSVWEGEYYNLYWDKKREEFKNIIIDRGTMETEANKNSSKNKSSSDKAKSRKNKGKGKNNSSKKNTKPKKNENKAEQNSEDRIEVVPDSDEDLDDIYR